MAAVRKSISLGMVRAAQGSVGSGGTNGQRNDGATGGDVSGSDVSVEVDQGAMAAVPAATASSSSKVYRIRASPLSKAKASPASKDNTISTIVKINPTHEESASDKEREEKKAKKKKDKDQEEKKAKDKEKEKKDKKKDKEKKEKKDNKDKEKKDKDKKKDKEKHRTTCSSPCTLYCN